MTLETIGKRIAQLRQENGWTQQALARQLAISRVAISHIEMNLTIPSERTIILLAGIFKLAPHELIAGTSYPPAKSERLPDNVAWYKKLELDLALLENDLTWIVRLNQLGVSRQILTNTIQMWQNRLHRWAEGELDDRDRELIDAAQKMLIEALAVSESASVKLSPLAIRQTEIPRNFKDAAKPSGLK